MDKNSDKRAKQIVIYHLENTSKSKKLIQHGSKVNFIKILLVVHVPSQTQGSSKFYEQDKLNLNFHQKPKTGPLKPLQLPPRFLLKLTFY